MGGRVHWDVFFFKAKLQIGVTSPTTIDSSPPVRPVIGVSPQMTWLHFWTCTTWLVLAGPPFAVANTACEDDDMSHLQLKETLGKLLEQFFFNQDLLICFFQKESTCFTTCFV